MRDLVAVLRQGLVVEFARGVWVQREVELVLPAEVKTGLGEGIIPGLRAGMPLGKIGRMGGDEWSRESLFETVIDPLVNATAAPEFVF